MRKTLKKNLKLVLIFTLILGNFLSQTSFSQELPTISVDGAAGAKSKDGKSFRGDEASQGENGRKGGDAKPPTDGEPGGQIDVGISHLGEVSRGEIQLDGYSQIYKDNQNKIHVRLNIGNVGVMNLTARGGNGQAGGKGGDGEKGGKGYDGIDATQYTNGTNGGSGFTGGANGLGTSGSSGGKGGSIRLRLKSSETHLAILTKPDVSGGSSGQRGAHGKPGSGGEGGAGGAGYTWYTPETREVTNPDGTKGVESYQQSHHNIGGSDGPQGDSGPRRSEPLHDGQNGDPGIFNIVVIDETSGEQKTYKSAFDVTVDSFKMTAESNIFEPGRPVSVSEIKITNRGGMPTPPNMPVELFLQNNNWVVADPIRLTVGQSIAPGQTHSVDGALTFKIKDTRITHPGERFVTDSITHIQAFQTGANRFFGSNTYRQDFKITFPIEITPISMLNSLSPGEASDLLWKVQNISDVDFGADSKLKREIQVKLGFGEGDLDRDLIEFRTLDGKSHKLEDGFLDAIAKLGPKGSARDTVIIRGAFKLKDEAAKHAHKSRKFQVDLSIGDGKGGLAVRQIREAELRASERYSNHEGADWLLVTNNQTTFEEVQAWKEAARRENKKLSVWDLSIYGYLSLTTALENETSLAEQFADKVVFLLNNEFDPGTGTKSGDFFLAQQEFLLAAALHRLKLVIVGSGRTSADVLLGQYLFPQGQVKNNSFKAVKEFFEYMSKRWTGDIVKYVSDRVENDQPYVLPMSEITKKDTRMRNFVETYDEIEIYKRLLIFKPKEKYLKNRAMRIAKRLERESPDQQFIVNYTYEPESKGGFGPFFKNWSLGRVEVRRSTDKAYGTAVAMEVDDSKIHSPEFILGPDLFLASKLGASFEDKVELLVQILKGEAMTDLSPHESEVFFERLCEVMLNDLVFEQMVLRLPYFNGISKTELEQKLKRLRYLEKRLTETASGFFENITERQDALMKLFVGLEIYERSQSSFFDLDWILPTRDSAISKISRKIRENLFKLIFLAGNSVDEKYMTMRNEWIRQLKSKRKSVSYKKYVPAQMTKPTGRKDITTAVEKVVDGSTHRVMPTRELIKYRQDQEQMSAVQRAAREAIDTRRGDLGLSSQECQILFGAGQPIDRSKSR